MTFPIAVLASGRGSNLQALIDAMRAGNLPVAITGVFSDKPDAVALERARAAGIPAVALRPKDFPDRASFDRELFAHVAAANPRLIVCAGYMRILSDEVVAANVGRMINIHPSLLPKYPGLRTHARALEAGDAIHGTSVHFVTTELDGGPVLARAEIDVRAGDTPDTLAERLLPVEHRLLVAAVALIARRQVVASPHGIAIDGALLEQPLTLGADGRLRDAGGFVAL
ncbi:MAG TPA: phosphoribosylglycinamide formyltransferase [Xanthomonadales bacterium]|nr:phosphoribosylglycinamide formyltransferase [Xanthomonadales bacterium]